MDYGATPLSCDKALFQGIERFVGGASTGQVGAAAMRYTNPNTKNFSFQKAWFFLDDDVQHIMISNIASKTNAPVYSVLDQKRHNGRIIANGARLHSPVSNTSNARTLWHDDVGYTFDGPYYPTVTVQTGNRTGNWSAIGTSTQPPTTVDLFSARIIHTNLTAPVAYTAYPGTDLDAFRAKSRASGVRTVRNDAQVAAVWDDAHQTAMIVFWDAAGGSVEIECAGVGTLTIGASANSAVIYRADKGEVTVSDPGQTLESLELVVHDQTLIIDLPSGGMAGSSVTTQLDG